MIFIFLLALILFGPKKLPVVAREVGKFVAEFKRASNDFKQQLQVEIERAGNEASAQESGRPLPQASGDSQSSPSILPPALPAAGQSETAQAAQPKVIVGQSSEAAPGVTSANGEQERLLQNARMAYDSKSAPERPPLVPDTSSAPPPAPLPPRPRPVVNESAQAGSVAETTTPQSPSAAADDASAVSASVPSASESSSESAAATAQAPEKG